MNTYTHVVAFKLDKLFKVNGQKQLDALLDTIDYIPSVYTKTEFEHASKNWNSLPEFDALPVGI